jgi:hypothetical protein
MASFAMYMMIKMVVHIEHTGTWQHTLSYTAIDLHSNTADMRTRHSYAFAARKDS